MNSGVQCYEGVYYSLTDQIEEFMIHANPYDPDIAYEFEAYLETLEYK